MINLLRAEFKRLIKSKFLIISFIGAFLFSVSLVLVRYSERLRFPEYQSDWSELIFIGAPYLIFVMAVFVGLFVGTEFSDGTVRNKLTVGHRRIFIYLVDLLLLTVTNLCLAVTHSLPALVLGRLLLGKPLISSEMTVKYIVITVFSIIALTALFVLISFAACNKASGAVLCLVTVAAMFFSSFLIYTKLREPEFYYEMTEGVYIPSEDGSIEFDSSPRKVENPDYADGLERDVLEFLNTALPVSQLYRILAFEVRTYKAVIFDILIFLASAAGGIWIFTKRDLK